MSALPGAPSRHVVVSCGDGSFNIGGLIFEISKFGFYVMVELTMKTLDPKAEYIVKNGKATAVILPLEQYTELQRPSGPGSYRSAQE